jgi:hypothetical protein
MDKQAEREIGRQLSEKLAEYWHEVDFNWGRNAGSYYTEDAIFDGGRVNYNGRREIQEFYNWRESRGARTSVHSISNFVCKVQDEDHATAYWICQLYAADGEGVLPTAPPIGIQRVVDEYVRQPDGEWLCKHRTWHALFAGGVPGTGLTPEEMKARMAKLDGKS